MIELDDTEVRTLLMTMALESDGYDVRQIAVMAGTHELEFSDQDTGELFSPETIARIYGAARARFYHCPDCDQDLPIDKWTRDSHGVDMCATCLVIAVARSSTVD
jgi:hypothetical protein